MTNPELEARIRAQPETEAFLVYGDWFAERGDPRGDLVALQTKLMARPDSRALRAREQALLAAHGDVWLGPLAASDQRDFRCTWFCGFVDWAMVGSDNTIGTREPAEMIDELATLPCIGLLRGLTIGKLPGAQPSYRHCVEAIARNAPRLLGLTRLTFDAGIGWYGDATSSVDLGPACRTLASLRSLTLHIASPNLDTLALPALQRLEVEAPHVTGRELAVFAKPWPALERLSIRLGDGDMLTAVGCDDLGPLLHGRSLPALEQLALPGARFADDIIVALARSQLLPRLRVLDLSRGVVSERGVRALVDHARAFAHLDEIGLDGTLAEDVEGIDQLESVLPNLDVGELRYEYDDVDE